MKERSTEQRLTVADLARRADLPLGTSLVSPSTRVIRGPQGVATLEPRAMQVLVTLIDASGTVMTRADIFRRCWGEAIVGEDSLNRALADIRRAMRAVGADGVSVHTVPRTGYRLELATEAAPASLATQVASTPAPEHRAHANTPAAELIADSDIAMMMGPPQGALRAIEMLDRAVRLDATDANAWGRLALAHASLIDILPPDKASATLDAAQRASRRALALAPGHPDALCALTTLLPSYGEWWTAEQRMREVLRETPDHLPTLDQLAFLLVAVGRAEEGARLRVDFAPRAALHLPVQYRLVYALWILGRIDEADRVAERAMQLWPLHPAVWFARLWVLAFTGRAERALVHLEQASTRPALPARMVDTLRLALAALAGRREADVTAARHRLLEDVGLGPSNVINAIQLLCSLGAVDDAITVAWAYLLEDGPLMASVRAQPGEFSLDDQRRRKTHMLFVPVAAPLRADLRFLTLVRRCGLEQYWQAAGVVPDFLRDE